MLWGRLPGRAVLLSQTFHPVPLCINNERSWTRPADNLSQKYLIQTKDKWRCPEIFSFSLFEMFIYFLKLMNSILPIWSKRNWPWNEYCKDYFKKVAFGLRTLPIVRVHWMCTDTKCIKLQKKIKKKHWKKTFLQKLCVEIIMCNLTIFMYLLKCSGQEPAWRKCVMKLSSNFWSSQSCWGWDGGGYLKLTENIILLWHFVFHSMSRHSLLEEQCSCGESRELTEAVRVTSSKIYTNSVLSHSQHVYPGQYPVSERTHLTSNTVSCGRAMCQYMMSIRPQSNSSLRASQPCPSDTVRLVQEGNTRF